MIEDGKIFFGLHVGDYAFHCEQSRNCFQGIPSRSENVREIERALYLEPKRGCLGSGHYYRVTLGEPLNISEL